MANLSKLSLAELRELYPDIKATSKKRFIELVDESLEVEEVIEEVAVEESKEDLVDYLYSEARGKKKILIEFESSMDADDAFTMLQFELFPKLNEEGILVAASSTRRDMSLNGTCYVRLACKSNYALVKTLSKFNTFKQA